MKDFKQILEQYQRQYQRIYEERRPTLEAGRN